MHDRKQGLWWLSNFHLHPYSSSKKQLVLQYYEIYRKEELFYTFWVHFTFLYDLRVFPTIHVLIVGYSGFIAVVLHFVLSLLVMRFYYERSEGFDLLYLGRYCCKNEETALTKTLTMKLVIYFIIHFVRVLLGRFAR